MHAPKDEFYKAASTLRPRAVSCAPRPLLPGAPYHAPVPHGNELEQLALALPGSSQEEIPVGEELQSPLHLHSWLQDLTNAARSVTDPSNGSNAGAVK